MGHLSINSLDKYLLRIHYVVGKAESRKGKLV